MDKDKLFKRFQDSRFTDKGEEHQSDPRFLEKLKKSSLALSGVVKKTGAQIRILLDQIFGRESNAGTRVYAISALLYFISPLDFLPDIIPGLGFTDDIAILGMVVGMVTDRLLKQKGQKSDAESAERQNEKTAESQAAQSDLVQRKSSWLDQKIEKTFTSVGREMEKIAQEHINRRVKAQLIIVIISLSGAILAAAITLILKYVFRVI